MDELPFELIQAYRARTFRTHPELHLKNQDEAIDFVNQRGFIFFWPINGILLPSLWSAVAGDRPVADEHDDPGHVTWGWKDSLLGGRAWYYAKILRKRATMVSMELVPHFYALTENYGAYDEDYLTQYEQGRLTLEAKQLYETLIKEGPLDTVALRRAAHMSSPGSESRFNRALADLQADFKIVPVAVTQAGAWHYAFAYDITARYYPEIPEAARFIGERTARCRLAEVYFRAVAAARPGDLAKLFGWKPDIACQAVEALVQAGFLRQNLHFENQPGDWIVLSEIAPA